MPKIVCVFVNNNPNWFLSICSLYTIFHYTTFIFILMLVVIDWNLWEFIACIMLCFSYYLKLINFKIKHLVPNYSHTYKAEDKTSLLIKRYNITQLCILYIIVSPLSCHATLLALRDETNNGCEGDNNLLSPFLILQPWRPCDILNWDTIYYLLLFQPLDLST